MSSESNLCLQLDDVKPVLGANGKYAPEPRPPNSGSILDIESFVDSFGNGALPVFPITQQPDTLTILKHFHRQDLRGTPQETYMPSSSPSRPFDIPRLTIDEPRNYGCTEPGKPFFWLHGELRDTAPTNVFARNEKRAKRNDPSPGWTWLREVWQYFGTYRRVWYGDLTAQDWIDATDDQRATLVECFVEYSRSATGRSTLSGWEFSNDVLTGSNAQKAAAVRRDLSTRAQE